MALVNSASNLGLFTSSLINAAGPSWISFLVEPIRVKPRPPSISRMARLVAGGRSLIAKVRFFEFTVLILVKKAAGRQPRHLWPQAAGFGINRGKIITQREYSGEGCLPFMARLWAKKSMMKNVSIFRFSLLVVLCAFGAMSPARLWAGGRRMGWWTWGRCGGHQQPGAGDQQFGAGGGRELCGAGDGARVSLFRGQDEGLGDAVRGQRERGGGDQFVGTDHGLEHVWRRGHAGQRGDGHVFVFGREDDGFGGVERGCGQFGFWHHDSGLWWGRATLLIR